MKPLTIRNLCAAAVFSGCALLRRQPSVERVQKFGYVNPERVYTET